MSEPKCVFNANHDACVTKFLNGVNFRAKVQSHKTRNSNKPVEPKSHTQKPGRQIVIEQRFPPNKSSVVHEKPKTLRSCLRWKSTGRIFKIVGLRWIPTGKMFTDSTTKVDSKPPNGSNKDITNPYKCKQTLNVNAGTLNLSASTSFNPKKGRLGVWLLKRLMSETKGSRNSNLMNMNDGICRQHFRPRSLKKRKVTRNPIVAQQTALDNALVTPNDRVKIGKCNMRINPSKTQKEPTYQVVLDALALSPCYLAFLITADVLKIFMQQFWFTISKIKDSYLYQFKLDKKKCRIDVEVFRDILQICPRLQNQEFDEPPSDEEIVSFVKELGYKGDIGSVTEEGGSGDGAGLELEGVSDDDDDDDQQGDDERTESDDDKSICLNKTDDEEETQKDEFVQKPNDYVPTDDETKDVDDEEYVIINEEIYDDVNVELKDAELVDERKGDEEMTDAENVNVENEEVNQENAIAQVQDEA
uniref:Uncharacterized protein n=1 Tax=Tanacetum cinerariifolium TaxID=118510 RepID=A0A6L2KRA5_TANCI|nr:hypothetical protein [Tanacetum cinerariifolium]